MDGTDQIEGSTDEDMPKSGDVLGVRAEVMER